MKPNLTKTLALAASLLAALPLIAEAAADSATPLTNAERLQWWQDARFGMFIHWGPISLKGTEIGWSRGAQVPSAEYDQLYRQFNPTNFNARQWVRIAKQAGMKYIVLTTKHHDGFCLWDTKLTDYNIMNTPFHRDVTRELADACRQQGIVFCTYHSVCDWRHPDYPLGSPGGKSQKPDANMDRYNQYLKGQLTELLKNYGPLGVLWFDGEWEAPWTVERGEDLYRHCRSLQDSLIINNRVGKARDGMAGTTKQIHENPGDYDTPEQTIGKFQDQRPWETCMTICNQWAWKPNDPMKSLQQCLQTLVLCAGGDGNLLFNVGPMPDGLIEPRQVERLEEMGDWLEKYGDTIYRTRGGPWKPTKSLASTRRGKSVFLHVFKCDGDTVTLPGVPAKVRRAQVLTGGKVHLTQEANQIVLRLQPASSLPPDHGAELLLPQRPLPPAREEIDTIIRLDFEQSVMDLRAVSLPNLIKATASNVYQRMEDYAAESACDDDSNTRWATDSGTKQAWVALEFPQAKNVSSVRINEAIAPRVQKFEFQYRDGNDWKTLFTGTELGASFKRSFEPVTARAVRLNILDATEGPTIAEIKVQ